MTGEHWDHGVGYDTYYSEGGFDSMINFAVTGGGALASGSVANTYQGYADQINTKEGFNVLSFMSSHDETLTRGDENTMLYNAAAFLLLPGGVQISTVTKPTVLSIPALHLTVTADRVTHSEVI